MHCPPSFLTRTNISNPIGPNTPTQHQPHNSPISNLIPSSTSPFFFSFFFFPLKIFPFHFPSNSHFPIKSNRKIFPTPIPKQNPRLRFLHLDNPPGSSSSPPLPPSFHCFRGRCSLGFRCMKRKVRASSRNMNLQGAGVCLLEYSVPPPPMEGEKARVEQQCLISSDGGRKRSKSKAQVDEGAAALEGSAAASVDEMQQPTTSEVAAEEEGGRERLKRHRREMAGRVWIPEIWGQEELLKDWIDCSAFDACLFPTGIGSARAALVEEGRRANNGGFRLENRC